jgi:hypothetical protein
MINVHVIGCSHSAGVFKNGVIHQNRGWVADFARLLPNVRVYNHSISGAGYQYFDYELSKLCSDDIIILQTTTPRSMFGSYKHYDNMHPANVLTNMYIAKVSLYNDVVIARRLKDTVIFLKNSIASTASNKQVTKHIKLVDYIKTQYSWKLAMERERTWYNKIKKMIQNDNIIHIPWSKNPLNNNTVADWYCSNLRQDYKTANTQLYAHLECVNQNNHLPDYRQTQLLNEFIMPKVDKFLL